jgi:UDP:flavonoid glycosyltransferase YjiC (YdhE family)
VPFVRVLLSCSLGGAGHLTPVVAAARALQRNGHEVLVLVPPALAEAARQEGVPFAVGAEPPQSTVEAVWERVRRSPPGTSGGIIDREMFAGAATDAMLPAARSLAAEWRPEAVVREPCDYASAVVAHEAGIPQAQVAISQSGIEYGVLRMVALIIDRHQAGVSEAIEAAPFLTPFPPTLDRSPWPQTYRFRQCVPDPQSLPDWWPGDRRPLVYLTFGSVAGHLPESRPAFAAALTAVAQLPVRVLMTVGRHVELASLGPLPSNVHVAHWVPQANVLATAELVICHGGSGTVLGALGAGVPLVICPLFADQMTNGRMASSAGAGVLVPTGPASIGSLDPACVRSAAEQVLRRASFREAAQAVAVEMSALPTLEQALSELAPAPELTQYRLPGSR